MAVYDGVRWVTMHVEARVEHAEMWRRAVFPERSGTDMDDDALTECLPVVRYLWFKARPSSSLQVYAAGPYSDGVAVVSWWLPPDARQALAEAMRGDGDG